MPCFKGLAVSIHTPEGPLPEYSIQKHSRGGRITSYIPVPPPKTPAGSTRPEQSTFAISITLLTPGSAVPYSRPAPTPDEPNPPQKLVGGLPGLWGTERGTYVPVVSPYVPLTQSPNETVAAYIHFDGRTKEEVATLLRRGVETWVNSRWVSVPDTEGGGLAEREFLFREVGLERWLNGLDLQNKGETADVVAQRIERRKKRLERRRRKREDQIKREEDSDEDELISYRTRRVRPSGERSSVLRYGDNKTAPVEGLSDDEGMFTSESDSSDEEIPEAEAQGQIKVSLFRVLASGEIKRGEYSPQFDAHDDDDEGGENGDGGDADIDHTTSFAKPKTLDPKTISTQTVTGIDPPDKPYATFVFFYRGEKQLQKMGILPKPQEEKPKTPAKRKSNNVDFGALPPLKPNGTTGFSGYRESEKQAVKVKDEDDMDSDVDDEDTKKTNGAAKQDDEDADLESKMQLSPEDESRRKELAEGVKKIQLKRQHSFDPSTSSTARKTSAGEGATATPSPGPSDLSKELSTLNAQNPKLGEQLLAPATKSNGSSEMAPPPFEAIGSPAKKQRASIDVTRTISPPFGSVGGLAPPPPSPAGASSGLESTSPIERTGALDSAKENK